MHEDETAGLSVDKTRSISITLIVVGVLFLVGPLVWDLNGGPSWLHAFTWVGGAAFAYGIVGLVNARRARLR